jgi:hypothetical protein
MNGAASADPVVEVIRLVEADHKATTEFIARLIGIQTATRAVVVPLASALAGLALTNHLWGFAAAAIPILVVGLIVEARNEGLRDLAHRRSTRLERIIQSYVTSLVEEGRPVQGHARDRLHREVDSYEFGLSRSLRKVGFKKAVGEALTQAVAWIYLVLIVLLGVIVGYALTHASGEVEVCLKDESGAIVHIGGRAVTLTGKVTIVACPKS